MGGLILSQIPLVLGIIMSPLAIIAVVAVLFSERARGNSIAFLTGWFLAIVVAVGGSYLVLTILEVHERQDPPLWVPILHIIIGVVLLVGAWFIYSRLRHRLHAMALATGPGEIAAAAPQLPKMLQSVEHFTAFRSGLLGFGLFILNPVDASCALAAAMNLRLSSISATGQLACAVLFCVIAASSVAIPVGMLLIRKEEAAAPLATIRNWIATNTKLLNVGLLVLIAAMQLSKGIQGL